MSEDSAPLPTLDGSDLSVAVIKARWNATIVNRLSTGTERFLDAAGVERRATHEVAGAYELPLAAKFLAASGSVDAIVVLGAVIRGETTHYELVAGECGRAIMDVQLETGVPIGMGVLTVENEPQAIARSEGPHGHNVGEQAAAAAIELALFKRIRF